MLALLVACAPTVETPAERQRAIDRADGDRLAAQLAALPGVVRADVALHRAVRDPLATTEPSPATSAVVVIVDDRADRTRIDAGARALAKATAPDIEPTVVVEVGAVRPHLARVGPFSVEESSKAPLKATLAVALALIAALAGWIAWTARRARG